MSNNAWDQLRPGSELFIAQASTAEAPFTTLSGLIFGGFECTGPDGKFLPFDPEIEFVSYCAVIVAGLIISFCFVFPLLYRIFDLSRHEKAKLSVNGQIAKVSAMLVPTLFVTWFYLNNHQPNLSEWFLIFVGYVAAILHHVQDGRVTVCCGELLVYWVGMLPVYLSIALNAYLSHKKNSEDTDGFIWILNVVAALSTVTFGLELYNPQRRRLSEGNSYDDANIFEKVSLSFANDLVSNGGTRNLTKEDFPRVPAGLNAVNGYIQFEDELNKNQSSSKYRVLRTVFTMLKGDFIALVILDILGEAVGYIQPSVLGLFLGSLVKYSNGEAPLFTSYYFAILLGATPVVTSSLGNLSRIFATKCQVFINVSLVSAIYRKTMSLSPGAREKFDSSKVMNLISVDAQQVIMISSVLPTLVSAPVGVIFSVWQLWVFLGPSMFSALVLYVILIPANGYISAGIGKLFPAQMAAKDKRNKLTSNAFRNIKSLKLYAWELPFFKRIREVRDNSDLAIHRKISLLVSCISIMWNMMGDMVATSVFITFLYLRQGALTPEIVFPSLMLLQLATSPFMALPMSITSLLRCFTSQERINELLSQENHDYANYYKSNEGVSSLEESAVTLEDATISWNGEKTDQKTALRNISFKATPGDLVCVTGRVGAGKTALLKAIAGELCITGGSISIRGSLAFCTQEAWLQNQTLRNNILFGQTYQPEWYETVIKACELTSDIEQMPKGDSTDVGERGISLSGGQKARVALARAVYSRADIFLLDDVLSAVDEHVSTKLISQLFGSDGLLASRTIILATNNVKVLSHSSLIIALEDKKVVAAESFAEVVKNGEKSRIYRLVEEFGHAKDLKQESEHIENRKAVVLDIETSDPNFFPPSLNSKPLVISSTDTRHESDDDEEKEKEDASLKIFKRYFGLMKPRYTIIFLTCLVISVAITNGTNIYLGYMSNKALETLAEARWYIATYLLIVVMSSAGILISTVWCNIVLALNISKKLHNTMLWNLMHAPMGFFDTTPLGRLVNRFTGDIASLDGTFPQVLYYTIRSMLNLIVNIVSIISGGPIVTVVIVPLVFFGNRCRKMYVPSSRKVSRMSSAANSPILSHIEESLKGQTLIRAFDRTSQFIEICEQRVDYWIRISFIRYNLSMWLGFRIQMMTALLMLSAASSTARLVGSNTISVGYSAVVIHFASRAGVMVRQTLDFLAQIEVSSVSLARILEYVDIKQEAPAHIEATEPKKEWPAEGVVEFKEFSARYTPEGSDVLKNLSFRINGAEKIGIVGRTGSGKSTLTMAIFRIIEGHSGHIEIDGVNTSTLGLFDLRSRLSIIPQDAQIFDGTLRENLDPLSTSDDAKLWEVLELCHLKTYFQNQELGLDTVLNDSGDNLSRGQAQLICLGRALIHEAKILILDEATASVDVETDKIVQSTIRQNFNNRTIITIAHRLNTIMDSDRIIVLDKGEIKEFDTPQNLLETKGLFYGLHNAEKQNEKQE